MKYQRYQLVVALLTAMTLPIFSQVSNDNEDEVYKIDARAGRNDFVPGQVLVKFKDTHRVQVNVSRGQFRSTSNVNLTSILQKYGAEQMEQLLPQENPSRQMRRARAYNGDIVQEKDLSQLYLVKLSSAQEQETIELIDELAALEQVEYAEPNYKMYIMSDDNIAADYSGNPMVSQQWYLDAYGVKELWNKPIVNYERPVIAIIDTGVDITHPDLKDNIWTNPGEENGRDDYDNDRNGYKNDLHGWDFVNNTPNMRDNNRHGTHVAGIAAAANNGLGIVGANSKALIMPITVLQSDGTGDNATLIKGINYAFRNGATVINMSIGTYGNSSALREALAQAYQSAVLVASAGNDAMCVYKSHPHPASPCFPAAYSFVLGVQATNSGGGLASFSNYDDDGPLTSCEATAQDPDGFNYELKAPGTGILSTIPGGGYQQLNGTSMASPLVAGAVSALMMVKQYDNQEILWGDLLHSDNIIGAYNVSDRPAELDIMHIALRERNTQTDLANLNKPMSVNTGEEVNIYPVVRSSFGKASQIKLRIAASTEVEIVTGEADFGFNLDAFGKMTSKNPLVIKVPDDMPNASTIDLTVQATCKESNEIFTYAFALKVNNMYTLKGMLTENMTLTPDHVYYVPGKFGVSEGVTLTIKPGTRLEFAKDAGLYGFGTLDVKGTPEAPIIMTAYDKSKTWRGVYSHTPREVSYSDGNVYTNTGASLFTLLPTEETPIEMSPVWQTFYYDTEGPHNLYFRDYIADWTTARDMTYNDRLLTDPNFITPAMLEMLNDWNEYFQKYPTQRTNEMPNRAYVGLYFPSWFRFTDPMDALIYCKIDRINNKTSDITRMQMNNNTYYNTPYYFDCVIHPFNYLYLNGERNVVSDIESDLSFGSNSVNANNFTNFINNRFPSGYCNVSECNLFNYYTETNNNKVYKLPFISTTQETTLPYYGTAREDILLSLLVNVPDFTTLDLSNMRKEPYKEAHGIVWKVLVNGKDAQDEQEELLPLGVGRHQFKVYFNRPMNKTVIPQISFGVVAPYTQHPVSEDGSWNDEGTIYTANVTIDGKTQSDGINRISVRDAEDNEFFPCPIEATRFNIMVQAVGSMASGFVAEAGLGNVKLTWNNEHNDFEDAMGFNVYRYTEGENGVNDTIRINDTVLDITATNYIDDNVTPGQTYYYYYKVLSTALQEYDISNVVAATPLTATRGDANGSGEVDVADVITTVNYITGNQPKPFVFDAADMNSDKLIDVFDVVGIVRGILNPSLLATATLNEESATYFVEDGVLYVESPVVLGGVQVQLSLNEEYRMKNEEFATADDLEGFECASAWLSDNDYLFLAYSMSGRTLAPGKHALLYISDAQVASLRLSDTAGRNVTVTGGSASSIDRMGRDVMTVQGIYDLQGRKLHSFPSSGEAILSLSGQNLLQEVVANPHSLKKGIYIINGKKVVK